MYILDTEGLGFQGDTILIQYQILGTDEIVLHEIFYEKVSKTLELIEDICERGIVGFNLAFDWFHLSQTYNILKLYLEEYGDEVPRTYKYYEIIDKFGAIPESGKLDSKSIYDIALKPKKAFDLMLYGRENILQVAMSQKPVYIRRVPIVMAKSLLKKLENMPLEPLVKGEWQIRDIDINGNENTNKELHPTLCNLRYVYRTRAGLKDIAKEILGYEDIEHFDSSTFKGMKEYPYAPIKGNYREFINSEVARWHSSTVARRYAEDDVRYTRDFLAFFFYTGYWEDFKSLTETERVKIIGKIEDLKGTGTTNHVLACQVGTAYWSGYSIDRPLVRKRLKEYSEEQEKNKQVINYNSPVQALEYIHELCDDMEEAIIEKTNKETLEELINNSADYSDGVGDRANFVYTARRIDKKVQLLIKLDHAGRLHVPYKVLGTKSNRMAGGGGGKGGINPQGLGSSKDIRELITFADEGYSLEGGDFSGFEVSIMEAVYNDEALREELLKGKSFHALVGMELYGMTYEEIKSEENKELYKKCKIYVFAEAYGADVQKLAEATGLSVEEVELAKANFQAKYQGINKAKKKIKEDFSCLNKDMTFKEPKTYVESLLGFRRYYEQEYGVARFLVDLVKEIEDFDDGITYERREGKEQIASSATKSALLGSCFNIQNSIMRASGNHQIQSIGGEMTKRLQERFWELQPYGCHPFRLKPFNVHDEIDIPMNPSLSRDIQKIKDDFVKEYKGMIPLLAIDWEEGENWHDIH